jgi:hypothetical protein
MDGVALKTLTVSFDEYRFTAQLNAENRFGPWFTLTDKEKQQLGSTMGPANPQGLNRYAYVHNNPVKYVDPSGHSTICTKDYSACSGARVKNESKTETILIRGDIVLPDGTVLTNQVIRLGPGESSEQLGMIDVDQIFADSITIDGYGAGYFVDLDDSENIVVRDNGQGRLSAGLGGGLFGWGNRWAKTDPGFEAAVRGNVTTTRGVNMSGTRQMNIVEAGLAREFIKRGWGDYRDCSIGKGVCQFPK